ncbi:unnamed protein product [Allacma fusca]|uniref:Cytochrome P450 n=1 Tax=Allacma fusca TaxID=39272 RepID=A0A8J2K997_9HEXA|nr:unnamed protein product [Allacma fusca]
MNLDRLNGDESPEKEKQKALDLLIREQERGQFGITDKYIRDEINAFTFAGHDTIASALTFTVFLLAANPDEQKLHLELDEVFGNDRDRNVDTSDLSRLKYLECCFKESLRLYPSAPFLMRKIDKDFQLDEEITLPTGLQQDREIAWDNKLP